MTNEVAVVVLGDVGRSPRMQYHALSIAQLPNTHVTLIGYTESTPHAQITDNECIDIHSLKPFPALSEKVRVSLLWPFLAVLKVLFQIAQLLYVLLFKVPRGLTTVLVQSPPAIPTILTLQIVCKLRGVKLVIDWHNLGYTLLQLSIRKSASHPIIRVAKWIEMTFGRSAHAHLFVTDAMKTMLVSEWGLQGRTYVLHDKPSAIFQAMSDKARVEFLTLFITKYAIKDEKDLAFLNSALMTKARTDDGSSPKTALGISSTSWTPDEDFSILLGAIQEYDEKLTTLHKNGGTNLPNLLFFITGKGPQKEMYQERICKLKMEHCHIMTVWLDAGDYPKLLGCSDIGVSLHMSSSGVDLPMKVVDMFGCCVPCLAVNFKCLDELVKVGVNGNVFDDSHQLCTLFQDTLVKFPSSPSLAKWRENLKSVRSANTWENEWQQLRPLFTNNNSSNVSSKDKKKK
eukprot:gene17174-20460_t